ncbi:MAG: hypothetical protein NTY50_08735 [Methylobacter sp.]|nr:hypothetical protein [Methylobacter sp.]
MTTIQNGIITTDIGSYFDGASTVIIQPDGKILAAGFGNDGTDSDIALVRYNSNGSLDSSFSGDGIVTTAIGSSSNETARLMRLQADGKILLLGSSSYSGGMSNLAIVRYNSNGLLDTSFSGDGKIATDIAFFTSIAEITTQTDGKILVAGTYHGSSTYDNLFALARYNSNGSLDTSFSSDGKVTTTIPYLLSNNNSVKSVSVQADGKILVAGDSNSNQFCLVRYNPDGSLDTSFDGDGTLAFLHSTEMGPLSLSSVTAQSDGKILVVGKGSWVGFILARLNNNGSLDDSFGGNGMVTTLTSSSVDRPTSVITQPDGKLLVAGYTYNGANYDFALVRYNSNGSLDTNFDGDGKVSTSISSYSDYAFSVIALADGKLLVVGRAGDGSNNADFALVRYNSDGSLDSTFTGLDKGFTITPLDGLITNESGNSVRFSVSMNTQSTRDVSVTFSSSDSSEGVVTNAPLTFTATNWATPQTFTVVGQDDTLVDGNVTYQVTATVNTIDVNYSGLTISPLALINNDNEEAGKIIKGDVGGAKSDVLVGGSGNDTLYGLKLKDDLSGGLGNDTLYGGSDSDVLFGEDGKDKLYGEQGNDYMDGGAGNDIFNGSIGNDTLIGGLGNDTLTGVTGLDVFRFNTALSVNNVDRVTDFVAADDTIQLENAIFTKLSVTGTLNSANLKIGTVAADSNDFVIYNKTTGLLFYDADGNGAGAAVQIAVLGITTHPTLTNVDFEVI